MIKSLEKIVQPYSPIQQRVIIGDHAIVMVPSFTKKPYRDKDKLYNAYRIEMYGITIVPPEQDKEFNEKSYRLGVVHGGECGRIFDYIKFGRITGKRDGDEYVVDRANSNVEYLNEILWDHHCAFALLSVKEYYLNKPEPERIVNPVYPPNSLFNPMDERIVRFHELLHKRANYMRVKKQEKPEFLCLSRGQISIMLCGYIGLLNQNVLE